MVIPSFHITPGVSYDTSNAQNSTMSLNTVVGFDMFEYNNSNHAFGRVFNRTNQLNFRSRFVAKAILRYSIGTQIRRRHMTFMQFLNKQNQQE